MMRLEKQSGLLVSCDLICVLRVPGATHSCVADRGVWMFDAVSVLKGEIFVS